MTDNKLQREEEFTDAVIFALVPFVKKGLYEL
ncbi:inosine/xanthosine triphosphatase [Candidatus Parvarchaeota archaeon]|nr:inosine/xanthosine triphosphatase [Candidatus Parvarchaeota archaeon]